MAPILREFRWRVPHHLRRIIPRSVSATLSCDSLFLSVYLKFFWRISYSVSLFSVTTKGGTKPAQLSRKIGLLLFQFFSVALMYILSLSSLLWSITFSFFIVASYMTLLIKHLPFKGHLFLFLQLHRALSLLSFSYKMLKLCVLKIFFRLSRQQWCCFFFNWLY